MSYYVSDGLEVALLADKPETTSDQKKLSQTAKFGTIKQGVKRALLQIFERARVETPANAVKNGFALNPLKFQCQILSSVLPRFWAKKSPRRRILERPSGATLFSS